MTATRNPPPEAAKIIRSPGNFVHLNIGDSGSDHPGALCEERCAMTSAGQVLSTTWLETADRDADRKLLGTYTNAAVNGLTSAQVATLKMIAIARITSLIQESGFTGPIT